MNLKIALKIFILIFIFKINFSCNEENGKNKIEIYTLKSNFDSTFILHDSIKKIFSYAPKFEVQQIELNEKPLITNEQILCIDTITGIIKLSAKGYNRILELRPSMKHGIKFAICRNKEPLFTGYFWSSYSSYGSTWNCIEYKHTEKASKPIKLNIYKGNGMNPINREKINFNHYPMLLKSIQQVGKIDCLD
ncbi:MAG: hypothetical protein KGZ81_06025 [Flavobacteriales bacterium]|jgi:hypothetical protein|nr:hypothetical protein [Flavobacteriales bacterium]